MNQFGNVQFYLGGLLTLAIFTLVIGIYVTETYFPEDVEYDYPTEEDDSILRGRASEGDADAIYRLGVLHAFGSLEPEGVVWGWFLKAAELGHAGAQTEVGNAYHNGWFGIERDWELACDLYIKAAEQGDELGQFNAAFCFRDKIGRARDDARATELFYRSARQGYGKAQFQVFLRYKEGVGVRPNRYISTLARIGAQRNDERAWEFVECELQFWEESFDHRSVTMVATEFANYYNDDWSVGLIKLAVAAQEGRVTEFVSTSNKHSAYLSGVSAEIDWSSLELQRALWLVAAQIGNKDAQRQLSEYYATESIFERDQAEADYWRQRANATN